jgi:FkbM family methyltransferase
MHCRFCPTIAIRAKLLLTAPALSLLLTTCGGLGGVKKVLDFSKIPLKSVLGRVLRWPLSLLPPGLKVPIIQGPLRGYRWSVGSGNHGYWLGSYESEKQLRFCQAVRENFVVFDIGAHVGFYSLLASVIVGDRGSVFAFEPLPRNLHFLRTHLEINGRKNVVVYEAAVGRRSGVSQFTEGSETSCGCASETGRLSVPMVSLDDLFSQGKIAIPEVVKMDIEGGEVDAIMGGQNLLKECHPIIFLATHGQEEHRNCIQLLSGMGYDLSPLQGSIESTSELIAVKRL